MPYHLYPVIEQVHFYFSRGLLIIAGLMFALAVYIGLIRHGDVTRTFRRGVYAVTALVVIDALLGVLMYAMNGRPFEEVHLIYGLGAVLSLAADSNSIARGTLLLAIYALGLGLPELGPEPAGLEAARGFFGGGGQGGEGQREGGEAGQGRAGHRRPPERQR